MALPSRNASNLSRWFRAATAFLHKRRKKRRFLRETRRICRDGSGRQLLFSANAKEQRFLREMRRICRDGSGWQESFSASAKEQRFLRETRQIFRDDSCRQESFSASAEGISLHPGNAAFCRDGSGRQLPFSTNAERTTLPSRNAAILFRTIIPARSSLPQVPEACASAALCGGAALPGRRRDEKFHILLLRERPA